jgi:DNA-directed RNA polymerase specialized sigma24 family protein
VMGDGGRAGVSLTETAEQRFTAFVRQHERALREALTAAFGVDAGREATADAMAYAWERWDRLEGMANPVGYLYVVGRNRALRALQRRRSMPVRFALPDGDAAPPFEPALAAALAGLSERERSVVLLLHGFHWTMSEIAETLDLSKSTIQSYAERALVKLRVTIGVGQ